jgi:pimeloyl-ACP methyl ester carboxylesterase
MTINYVQSYDKIKIAYEVNGFGKPLIFCYGVACHSDQWKYQTKHFGKKYQVIHIDYRGHNLSQSPRSPEQLTLAGCSGDLMAVIKKLKIERTVLIGHSMGVNVILQFAALWPKKIAGIVCICGTAQNPFKTMFNSDLSQLGFEILKFFYLKFPDRFPKIWKKTLPSAASRILAGLFGFNHQFTKKQDIKTYLEGVAKQPTETFFHFMQEMSQFDGDNILKKIKAPALVIGGTRDLITPIKNQYAIYRKLQNAEFMRVPQGSHCAHVDQPELVNLRIEKFLNDIQYYL